MNSKATQAARAGQAEFVRWFGPLLEALRDLGGSASPREAVDRIAEAERVPSELLDSTLKSGQSRLYNQVRQGKTKLQFIIDAVERALRRNYPYELMQRLIAEEESGVYSAAPDPADSREQPCETEASKKALRARLRAKHGVGRAR